MSLGISSSMFSNTGLSGLSGLNASGAQPTESSFGDLFQEAQGYMENPTGLMGGSSTDSTEEDADSFSRLSNDAFQSVRMQIQMKLQTLLEKQKAAMAETEHQSQSPQTDMLIRFADYLGSVLDTPSRSEEHPKAEALLDKVLAKLQANADKGDLDAQAYLVELMA